MDKEEYKRERAIMYLSDLAEKKFRVLGPVASRLMKCIVLMIVLILKMPST